MNGILGNFGRKSWGRACLPGVAPGAAAARGPRIVPALGLLALLLVPTACLYWIGEPIRDYQLRTDSSKISRGEAHQLVSGSILALSLRCDHIRTSENKWALQYYYAALNPCRSDPDYDADLFYGCSEYDYLDRNEVYACQFLVEADPCVADIEHGSLLLPAPSRLAAYAVCAKAFQSQLYYPTYSLR